MKHLYFLTKPTNAIILSIFLLFFIYANYATAQTTCYPTASNYWTGTTDGTTKTDVSEVRGYSSEDGWFMFDISAIPDGSFITSVEFHGYVNNTNWPYWSMTPVTSDPLTAGAAVLHADIIAEASAGYYLYQDEGSGYTTGWKVHTLGGTANTDLQAALTQDWFAMGMVSRDNSTTYYINWDGWNETNVPYIVVSYSEPVFYAEGFEGGAFGTWTNSSSDDFNWTNKTGGTNSSNTGPSGANEGTRYIYTETSSPVTNGDIAILESPGFDFTSLSNPEILFDYHMYFNGSANGGTLNLDVSTDGGSNWSNLWTKSGDQGNTWHDDEIVSLSTYGGSTIHLRFHFTVGTNTSYQNDCALDDIKIKEGTPLTPPSCTTPVSPLNGATAVTIAGNLEWNAVSGATGYKLWFGTDGGGTVDPTSIANGVDLGNVTTYAYSGLAYITNHYWKIVPYNTFGDATGCSIWSFTTQVAPPANDDCTNAIAITSPYPATGISGSTIGATIDCSGWLDWDAVWYTIELPYTFNTVDITLCLDNEPTLANTGIILVPDCSCDGTAWVASYTLNANCVSLAFEGLAGPATVYYPVMAEPKDYFTLDVDVNPTYCASTGNMSYATAVTEVIFNTLSNATLGKTNPYEDFTSMSTAVEQGTSYDLTVNMDTDGNYTCYAMAWIDWNQDLDFDDPGETYDLGSNTDVTNGPGSNCPYSITVPTDAVLGVTRMRTSVRYGVYATACETGYDGEVEDYSIEVVNLETARLWTGYTDDWDDGGNWAGQVPDYNDLVTV